MNFRLAWDAAAWEKAVAGASVLFFLLAWARLRARPAEGRTEARRSAILWGLRAAFLLGLLGSLLRPAVLRLQSREEKPKLAILLDRSHWMALKESGRSRFDLARTWLERHRRALESRADVEYYLIGDRAVSAGAAELGQATPSSPQLILERALAGPLTHGRRPALWLLSDGVGDASEDLDASLGRLGVPVRTLGVGRPNKLKGLTLSGLQVPDFVFLHEPFPVDVRWEASGLKGGRVRVRLSRDGQPVAEAAVDLEKDFESRTSSFKVVPGGLGEESYRLELAAAGESVAQPFRTEVIRQKLRIMFLCGQPSFEYAHLREFLKADPNHELVSFVILRNPDNLTPVPESELSLIPFPAQEIFVQTLPQFDLFILQDFAFWRFGLPAAYLQSLKTFVERGGGLLVVGGDQAFSRGGYKGTPLEDILPVELLPGGQDYESGPFAAEPLALDHPLVRFEDSPQATRELWSSLPQLDGFNRFLALRRGATALATAPGQKLPSGQPLPVFSTMEVGKGRVMVAATNSTWRWKLGSGERWKASNFYTRFWTRSLQYLAGSLNLKKVQFAPLPARLSRPPVTLSLRVFDERFKPLSGAGLEVKILWTEPGGAPRELPASELEPGVFGVRLDKLKAGEHRFRGIARYQGRLWGEAAARFTWAGTQEDFEPMNQALLERVATATGGEYAPLEKVPLDAWLAKLPEPVPTAEVQSRAPLGASSTWLTALIALLGLEWYLRRRWGYP